MVEKVLYATEYTSLTGSRITGRDITEATHLMAAPGGVVCAKLQRELDQHYRDFVDAIASGDIVAADNARKLYIAKAKTMNAARCPIN